MQAAWLLLSPPSALPAVAAAPDLVFAAQYWSVMVGGAYLLCALWRLDWAAVLDAGVNALGAVGALLSRLLALTFLDWSWVTTDRR